MAWWKWPGSTEHTPAAAEADKPSRFAVPSKYQALYKYLDNRYASTVVLTFGEIEDLLGSTLPDVARLEDRWWANAEADSAQSAHSCAWTRASRIATPNLRAQTVVFERAVA